MRVNFQSKQQTPSSSLGGYAVVPLHFNESTDAAKKIVARFTNHS